MALVHVLANLPRGRRPAHLGVLFLDHGLRCVEVDRDSALEVATRLGATWHEASAEPGALARNTQAASRDWRYATASSVASRNRYDLIATGHHADDQLETLLYGLAASSGLAGLTGMQLLSQLSDDTRVLRPLLGLTRKDIDGYLDAHSLRFAQDPSNDGGRFRRSRIRAEVVPRLLDIHPGAGPNLERSGRQLTEARQAVDELSALHLGRIRRGDGQIDCAELAAVGPATRHVLVATWLRQQGLGRALTERLVHAVSELAGGASRCASVAVPGGVVSRDGDQLKITTPRS